MEQRFSNHVDHVGSLVRPPSVLTAFDDLEDGKVGKDGFRAVVENAIREAVRMQEDIGLPYITDGEFRRRSYSRGIIAAIDGFEQRPTPYSFRAPDGRSAPVNAGYASGKLKRRHRIVADDFAFLKSVARNEGKVTLPAPSYFHFGLFGQSADRNVYRDTDELFADLLAIYREEIADLASLGCRMIQLDETALALLCDPQNQEIARREGEDPDRLIAFYIDLLNEVSRACASGMKIRVHLCRGNRVGMWAASGGYEPIAERLFNTAKVDAFLMEFDSSRSGGFEPLRFLPKEMKVYLGLISTKAKDLEPQDELVRGFEEASKFAPAERLGLCPQCGFGASALRKAASENPMTPEIQAQKLRRLIEAAEKIWT
jgi:5-methyltetrahydropteroyltriglutamate--homocysteine methyltransferase